MFFFQPEALGNLRDNHNPIITALLQGDTLVSFTLPWLESVMRVGSKHRTAAAHLTRENTDHRVAQHALFVWAFSVTSDYKHMPFLHAIHAFAETNSIYIYTLEI